MNTVTDTLYCSGVYCNNGFYADVKDNGFSVSGKYKGFSAGYSSLADIKDNGSASVGYKGFKVGGSWADNSTVCDSAGNCMVRDNLMGDDNSHYATGSVGSSVTVSDNLMGDLNSHYAIGSVGSVVSVSDNLVVFGTSDKSKKIGTVGNGSTVTMKDNLVVFGTSNKSKTIGPVGDGSSVTMGDNLWSLNGSAGGFSGGYKSKLADVKASLYDRARRGKDEQTSYLYVKRSRCGHEPNYADVKDNGFSVSGTFKGFSAGYSSLADNSTVCDSRGNCIVRDALYTKGPCITDEEWAAGVRGGPHAAAIMPDAANMGIPAGMNVGIPAGLPNGANMGIPAGMMMGHPMAMGQNVANMQQMYGY